MQTAILCFLSLALGSFSWVPVAAAGPLDDTRSKFVKLDDLKVHYKSLGEGSTAVVFIHGWTCDHTFWGGQVDGLKGKCRMILIDLPGHGHSDKPKIDYTMDLFAKAVDAVLKDAGVDSAVLVGHSMGTPVMRQYYRLYPKKTKALVAVDGSLRPFLTKREELDQFVARFTGPMGLDNRRLIVDGMLREDTPADVRERIKKTMTGTPEHVAVSAMRGMFDPAVWKEDVIKVPLQSIQARSAFWSADYEAFVRKLAPDVDFHVMDDVSHFLMMEKPKEFNALLIGFLKKQGAVRE